MANLYLMRSRSDELNTIISTNLLKNYSKIYKNIAIYCPVIYIHRVPVLQGWLEEFNINQTVKSAYGFTFREAMEEFSKDPHNFFNVILEEYEELKRKYDFVLVNSFCEFGILDGFDLSIKLAKNLNTPIAAIINDEDKLIAQKYFDHALDGRNYVLINENFNFEEVQKLEEYDFITPHRFKYELIKQSVKNKKTVVLPESNDERILKAAEILLKSKVVDLILLGDEEKIKQDAARLSLDLSTIQIMNPLNSEYNQEFTSILYEARKSKGMSLEEAKMLVQDKTYFGTLLIHTGKADAMVSGASTTTAETIRPALQLIKTKEGIRGYVHVVDGITPVEQPSEIEARVEKELPTEVANELTLKGKYAIMQRFLGGISTMPIHTTYEDEHNYAELQSQITDLMTIVSALLEATPSSLALDANTLLRIRDTLSRNVSINNKIKDSLSKVGL